MFSKQKQQKAIAEREQREKKWKFSFLIRAAARRHKFNKFRSPLLPNRHRIDLVEFGVPITLSLTLTHSLMLVGCVLQPVLCCQMHWFWCKKRNKSLMRHFQLISRFLFRANDDNCIQAIQTFTWLKFHSHLATQNALKRDKFS